MAAVGEFLRDHGFIKAPEFEHSLMSREGIGERLRYRRDVLHDSFRDGQMASEGMGPTAVGMELMIDTMVALGVGVGACAAAGWAIGTLPVWGSALAIGVPIALLLHNGRPGTREYATAEWEDREQTTAERRQMINRDRQIRRDIWHQDASLWTKLKNRFIDGAGKDTLYLTGGIFGHNLPRRYKGY